MGAWMAERGLKPTPEAKKAARIAVERQVFKRQNDEGTESQAVN